MNKLWVVAVVVAFSAVGIFSDVFCQDKTPVRGGILREIRPNGPKSLSYYPEMGPDDSQAALPAAEKLMDYTADKHITPLLAESVSVAKDGKSITFKLKKGIKFHDGSDFNAEVVAWNYRYAKETKRLQYDSKLLSVDVLDDYTVRLNITQYTNQIIHSFGWVPIFSKVAWDKAGGGDIEKSKAWARANIVGTGPFKLVEYKRDDHIKWVRNENYWQKGKPYLDGIEVRYIPDSVTASAVMQAKQADVWIGAPAKDQADLEKKGLIRQSGYGTPRIIYLNNKDPNSKFANQKVREAVEYAIDKPAMAKALGFGYYTPMTMVAPPGEWGYDPDYKGRPYDPAKARQLLAEAGYPNGLSVKLVTMAVPPWPDEAQAIKRYMDDAGFTVDLDMADPGRFYQTLWMRGWPDMILFLTGMDPNYLISFHRNLGPDPMSNFASLKRPPDLVSLSQKSLTLVNEKEQMEITKPLVRMISDEALVVPLYLVPAAYVIQPWVHTTYLKEQLVTRRYFEEWMDKH